MKTSSTPQTNWSHSLSQGTSTPETSLEPESHSSIDAVCILYLFYCPSAKTCKLSKWFEGKDEGRFSSGTNGGGLLGAQFNFANRFSTFRKSCHIRCASCRSHTFLGEFYHRRIPLLLLQFGKCLFIFCIVTELFVRDSFAAINLQNYLKTKLIAPVKEFRDQVFHLSSVYLFHNREWCI